MQLGTGTTAIQKEVVLVFTLLHLFDDEDYDFYIHNITWMFTTCCIWSMDLQRFNLILQPVVIITYFSQHEVE